MKRNMNAAALSVILGAVLVSAFGASAQEVKITGSPLSLNVIASPEEMGQVKQMEADQFEVLAQAGDDLMLIRVGEEEGYVSKEELKASLPRLDCDSFPKLEDVKAVTAGSPVEEVAVLQEALDELGLLSGGVDGLFGPGTAGSVSRFQEMHGLDVTGSADLYTMLAIEAAASGLKDTLEISNEQFASAEEKFSEIIDRTEADLEPFLESTWIFDYDAFEEEGAINPGLDLGMFAVSEPEVDQISGDLAVKVLAVKDPDMNIFTLIPAITVDTEGAYRPYLKELVLAGEKTLHLEGGVSSGEIKGIYLKENGYVPLTKEAMELLAGGSVKSVRVVGRNTEYDVDVEYDSEQMAAFMEACETLA